MNLTCQRLPTTCRLCLPAEQDSNPSPKTFCVHLNELLNLPEPSVSHLQMKIINGQKLQSYVHNPKGFKLQQENLGWIKRYFLLKAPVIGLCLISVFCVFFFSLCVLVFNKELYFLKEDFLVSVKCIFGK